MARIDGKSIIVKDWVEINKYDDVGSPIYSPDGKSFVFRAIKDGKWIIVKDWVEMNKYDKIDSIIYSPDGKSFAFEAQKDGKWIIVKDWVESNKYDRISDLTYSPDGKNFAFRAEKVGSNMKMMRNKRNYKYFKYGEVIVKDWVESNEYNKVASLKYSPDGKSFAFVAIKDWKQIIVKEDCENLNSSVINKKNINQANNTSTENNSIKKENNNIYLKLDSKLETLYKKISKKDLKYQMNTYKKFRTAIIKLQKKYTSWPKKELVDYLYEKINSKYIKVFKEYVKSKKNNNLEKKENSKNNTYEITEKEQIVDNNMIDIKSAWYKLWESIANADLIELDNFYADEVLLLAGSELLKSKWELNNDGDKSKDLLLKKIELINGYKKMINTDKERWVNIFSEDGFTISFSSVEESGFFQSREEIKETDTIMKVRKEHSGGSDTLIFVLRPTNKGVKVVMELTDY